MSPRTDEKRVPKLSLVARGPHSPWGTSTHVSKAEVEGAHGTYAVSTHFHTYHMQAARGRYTNRRRHTPTPTFSELMTMTEEAVTAGSTAMCTLRATCGEYTTAAALRMGMPL